nr:hypothetical protein Iba_chr03bCG8400 [Ipomoea batatas]GMC75796.1 hypothetical protein Iba_chr03dCG8320 [Ipomoea batatas]GME01518.1 hypothetical protein Iba_scaffold553842CG0010 [Ipomoea batatas]
MDLLDLASAIGVMFPTCPEAGLAIDLEGTDILLGGLAGLSLPFRSRTPTLLLTDGAGFPLVAAEVLEESARGGFSSLSFPADRSGYRSSLEEDRLALAEADVCSLAASSMEDFRNF